MGPPKIVERCSLLRIFLLKSAQSRKVWIVFKPSWLKVTNYMIEDFDYFVTDLT